MKKIFINILIGIIIIISFFIFKITVEKLWEETEVLRASIVVPYQSFQGVTANYDTTTGYIVVHDTNISRLISFQGSYPKGMKHLGDIKFVNEEGFKQSIYGKAGITITK